MKAYRCDMCHRVWLLDEFEDAPMAIGYNCRNFDVDDPVHRYDICHDCAQKIERFISDNVEEVRKKVLE